MNLSIVDAQDIYLSAKAFTAVAFKELEAKWHEPALQRIAELMIAMGNQQRDKADQIMSPEMPEELEGGTYGETIIGR